MTPEVTGAATERAPLFEVHRVWMHVCDKTHVWTRVTSWRHVFADGTTVSGRTIQQIPPPMWLIEPEPEIRH